MADACISPAARAALDAMDASLRSYFESDIQAMRSQFPDAVMDVLKSTGELYWLVSASIPAEPPSTWHLMVIYGTGYDPAGRGPHSDPRVMPLKPDIHTLQDQARTAGRGSLPHIWRHGSGDTYLSLTALSMDFSPPSAHSAVRRAVSWAWYYETGLRDSSVWAEFCKIRRPL